MPFQKEMKDSNEAHNQAVAKYRRLQTLIKKVVELSEKCGIALNLLVEDRQLNKITEHHTDEQIKLDSIINRMRVTS